MTSHHTNAEMQSLVDRKEEEVEEEEEDEDTGKAHTSCLSRAHAAVSNKNARVTHVGMTNEEAGAAAAEEGATAPMLVVGAEEEVEDAVVVEDTDETTGADAVAVAVTVGSGTILCSIG